MGTSRALTLHVPHKVLHLGYFKIDRPIHASLCKESKSQSTVRSKRLLWEGMDGPVPYQIQGSIGRKIDLGSERRPAPPTCAWNSLRRCLSQPWKIFSARVPVLWPGLLAS